MLPYVIPIVLHHGLFGFGDIGLGPIRIAYFRGIDRALKERGPNAKVVDAMTSPVPTIGHRRCLDEALRILMEKSAPAVAVVDPAGRLVGLVTSETIGEMMMVQQALPKGVGFGTWGRPASP